MYLAWAAYYEGATDASYFDTLVPKVLEEILLREGRRAVQVPETPALRVGLRNREVASVAQEICAAQEAFYLLFVHADVGGRGLEAGIANRREAFAYAANDMCNWPLERTVYLSPRHETEAWALADPSAICRAFGFTGSVRELELPTSGAAADRIVDPKAHLSRVIERLTGRRGMGSGYLTAIAQEQAVEALRTSPSFCSFEAELRNSLVALGCLRRAP